MNPSHVEDECIEHPTSVGLALHHVLKVDEVVGMEDACGYRRSGGVPIVDGHRGQRHFHHLSIHFFTWYFYPVVYVQQVVDAEVDERRHAFQRVLENPCQYGTCDAEACGKTRVAFHVQYDDEPHNP